MDLADRLKKQEGIVKAEVPDKQSGRSRRSALGWRGVKLRLDDAALI
jgi:hypothetical protein